MALIPFHDVDPREKDFGGKAWGLAQLARGGFPVPEGLILIEPVTERDLAALEQWHAGLQAPVAVRSSASAEDGAETSFAGQNRSFLNVVSNEDLRRAIDGCFESGRRPSSLAYRRHFTGQHEAGRMNVVIQRMVDARFAGVFFSRDPRTGGPWILEVIPGLGEDLVSGKVTPGRARGDGTFEALPEGFPAERAREVSAVGLRVAESLGFEVDMEWAIDAAGRFWVLQARPITTHGGRRDRIRAELARLEASHGPGTAWDGQTFAEWSGAPSPFTFSLWREAFSPRHAFGEALRELGYAGFDERSFAPGDSLLEDVFGRAYLNLERMTGVYYGAIPYKIEARPRPHTRFDARRITPAVVAHMPAAVWSMLKVSWNVSVRRRAWLQRSSDELNRRKTRLNRSQNVPQLATVPFAELHQLLLEETRAFSVDFLHWPLLLTVLTESTIQNLQLILGGVLGKPEAGRRLRAWMAAGLHTITREMMDEMREATLDPKRRPRFLARYGHRGAGEMDLARPRWSELGEGAFQGRGFKARAAAGGLDVEADIRALQTFRRDIILDEWRLFKRLLEHREQWKMELLKPYAQVRYLLEEMGRRVGLGSEIHWLETTEVAALAEGPAPAGLRAKIRERQERQRDFRGLALPEILTLDQLESLLSGQAPANGDASLSGEPLSPGIACGELRFVEDPSRVDLESWPDDVILAAESTDPGWTELFLRAKGIVVERGGVLSHSAIVARELSIPAVSGIPRLRDRFKDGDRVWVDGDAGCLRREGPSA